LNPSGAPAFSYLIGTLIDLYVAAVLLRLLLQWTRADFYNPLSQFLIKLTNPTLVPLRRIIPAIGRLDTAAVVLMLALEFCGIWLISQIGSSPMGWGGMIGFSIIKLIMTLLMTYFFLIIIGHSELGRPGVATPIHATDLSVDRACPEAHSPCHSTHRRHRFITAVCVNRNTFSHTSVRMVGGVLRGLCPLINVMRDAEEMSNHEPF